MQRNRLLLGILVTVVTIEVVQSRDYQVPYGANLSLSCYPDSSDFHPSQPADASRLWILPHDVIYEPGQYGTEHMHVTDFGAVLHVEGVGDDDFGMYYCVVKVYNDEGPFFLVSHGINTGGPYYGDLAAKYLGMAQTGLIAAAVCFACALLLCGFYARQQTKLDHPSPLHDSEAATATVTATDQLDKKQSYDIQQAAQKQVTQYTNLAYVAEGSTVAEASVEEVHRL